MNTEAKYLLVVGCQRSGTTILSACLGRHPDINMMIESTGNDIMKGIGKEYNGNKLCLHSQIRFSQRASRFGYLVNRVVNLNKSYHKRRPFPTSKLSIQDYCINLDAKIIHIVRNKQDVIRSMMRRAGFSEKMASKHYDKAIQNIVSHGLVVYYEDFVKDNESVLREVCEYLGLPFDERMLEGQKFNYKYKNYYDEHKRQI